MLVQPLLAAGQGKLIYTDIFEAFFVEVKVALFAALMLSFPVIATQLWRFVAPGLYAKEKKAFLPFLLMTPVLLRRRRVPSLISSPCPGRCISCSASKAMSAASSRRRCPAVGNYLNFVTRFLFGFGVAFLLPILLMILERAGIVTREQLAKSRRYAIVAAAAVAAVLTPPDVGVDAAAAGAALRALRIRDPRHPAHPLARGAQGGRAQTLMSLLSPRQKRARKRHRGGGGLAVPGPFKRIARAGGQKVTIRTAQRPFFAIGSELRRKFFWLQP